MNDWLTRPAIPARPTSTAGVGEGMLADDPWWPHQVRPLGPDRGDVASRKLDDPSPGVDTTVRGGIL